MATGNQPVRTQRLPAEALWGREALHRPVQGVGGRSSPGRAGVNSPALSPPNVSRTKPRLWRPGWCCGMRDPSHKQAPELFWTACAPPRTERFGAGSIACPECLGERAQLRSRGCDSSSRLQASSLQNLIANGILESHLTHSKQTTAIPSNREKSRHPRIKEHVPLNRTTPRAARGRAGINPRHKLDRVCFPTTCAPPRTERFGADSPAQSPPRGVDVRTCRPSSWVTGRGSRITNHDSRITSHSSLATAFLIGNKVTIEFAPTHSKQRRGTNSNR
jgi:hypothetical protein